MDRPDRDESENEAEAEVLDAELPRLPDDLPPLDFSTFIVSLRTSAMMHMGGLDDEGVNLVLARQEIDLLGLLEQETDVLEAEDVVDVDLSHAQRGNGTNAVGDTLSRPALRV